MTSVGTITSLSFANQGTASSIAVRIASGVKRTLSNLGQHAGGPRCCVFHKRPRHKRVLLILTRLAQPRRGDHPLRFVLPSRTDAIEGCCALAYLPRDFRTDVFACPQNRRWLEVWQLAPVPTQNSAVRPDIRKRLTISAVTLCCGSNFCLKKPKPVRQAEEETEPVDVLLGLTGVALVVEAIAVNHAPTDT